jgi:histidyl-tRNA synthetase
MRSISKALYQTRANIQLLNFDFGASMKNLIQSVKGTREFYPEDMALRNFINDKVRQASQSFGYQEWDGPFIETIDLYAAKSGEELVKKQSFVFADRGGDQVTLRPELTPSLARMIAKKQGELTFPVRWWSFGPFWRYEQPQRGRSREFFQWNIDLLGANSPESDAELIAVAVTFFKLVGLKPDQVKIRVNDRQLMESQFGILGIPLEKRAELRGLIDRRSKMKPDAWDSSLTELCLNKDQVTGLDRILENKELFKTSESLVRVFAALDALGMGDYVIYDPNIMRGLLYYTGTVFEAFDLTGSVPRAIFGGGRYDNLLADVGGEPLPAVGFAMGDVVIGLLLKEAGLIPSYFPSPAPILVTVFEESLLLRSYSLASLLRESGLNAAVYPEPAKLPKQFKYADKMGIKVALVVGPDEEAKGFVTVKNLVDGSQQTVSRSDLLPVIQKILETG